jgi:hypothetical protein
VADPAERPDHVGTPGEEDGGGEADGGAFEPTDDVVAFDPTAVADELEATARAYEAEDQHERDEELDEPLAEIAEQAQPDRKKLVGRVLLLLVTAIAFYVLAPPRSARCSPPGTGWARPSRCG